MYHSTDLLTTRGVAHLVVHGTSGSTSYETIPLVPLESSGGVLSTVDMVVQWRDGPHQLRDHDDDDDESFTAHMPLQMANSVLQSTNGEIPKLTWASIDKMPIIATNPDTSSAVKPII